jgi:hypothetical protein
MLYINDKFRWVEYTGEYNKMLDDGSRSCKRRRSNDIPEFHIKYFVLNSDTIKSTDWTHRQAATIALGILMYGPSKIILTPMVETAFPLV